MPESTLPSAARSLALRHRQGTLRSPLLRRIQQELVRGLQRLGRRKRHPDTWRKKMLEEKGLV